jgi:hypothetical protein
MYNCLCICNIIEQLATWIGFTRVTDYWHSVGDVIMGWILGK